MPKKQLIVKETAVAAPPARAAKPKTPRVRAAKHSKTVSTEVVAHMEIHMDVQTASREAIAQIAYSYWEARGYQHGGDLEDWVRAEHEYRSQKAKSKN
jgi:Protein of unknown function (DUF2934)